MIHKKSIKGKENIMIGVILPALFEMISLPTQTFAESYYAEISH